jgi:hypothetical protein
MRIITMFCGTQGEEARASRNASVMIWSRPRGPQAAARLQSSSLRMRSGRARSSAGRDNSRESGFVHRLTVHLIVVDRVEGRRPNDKINCEKVAYCTHRQHYTHLETEEIRQGAR